ncbi:MAG: thiamine-phosphate kinase [Bacteroidales bacterium]
MTSEKRTELSELGEFGLIAHLTKKISIKNSSTQKGVGDDCAVIEYDKKVTLVTTDMLAEGIHFDLTYHPLKHLGYKAAIVNFSDILAMNGIPRQMLVSMAVSNRFSLEALEEIYAGMLAACERYGVDLVGGDTVSSKSGLVLSVTVLGEADMEKVVYRNTAGEGDLLCVTGDLGAAYMGLLLLEREKKVYADDPSMQPDLEGHDYILQRQLKPELRSQLKGLLEDIDVKPTAMIDISDGLASEILHLCNDSNVGCSLYEEKIPIDPATVTAAEMFGLDPTLAALNGGEDYELLFTISQNDYEKIHGVHWIAIIGHLTAGSAGANLISRSGQSIPLNAQGWDAFKKT